MEASRLREGTDQNYLKAAEVFAVEFGLERGPGRCCRDAHRGARLARRAAGAPRNLLGIYMTTATAESMA